MAEEALADTSGGSRVSKHCTPLVLSCLDILVLTVPQHFDMTAYRRIDLIVVSQHFIWPYLQHFHLLSTLPECSLHPCIHAKSASFPARDEEWRGQQGYALKRAIPQISNVQHSQVTSMTRNSLGNTRPRRTVASLDDSCLYISIKRKTVNDHLEL